MTLVSKKAIIEILSNSKTENIFSIWEFENGLNEICYKIIFKEINSLRQEISFLIKEPIKDNPVCLYRNQALTYQGKEWLDPISFHSKNYGI